MRRERRMAAKEDQGDPKERNEGGGCKMSSWCRRNGFLVLLVLSIVLGYVLGVLLRPLNVSDHTLYLIGFPGDLVIRSFLMIIVPLLFCSLVLGLSSLRKGGDTRLVILTISFFVVLSTFSGIMGAVAGHAIHPGQKITHDTSSDEEKLSGRKELLLDSLLDLFWNAVPSNIMEATFSKEHTYVEVLNEASLEDNFNTSVIFKKTLQQSRGVNFIGLLTFSILFGYALAVLGEKGEQLHSVIEQLNLVVMKIMGYCVRLLPVGMFFWMLKEGLRSGNPGQILGPVAMYLASFFGCVAFHQLVLLPLLYLVLVRKNPFRYHLNLLPAILTAFGTSSSSATLPMTLQCVEETNRVNKCVTRFVIPLGTVVHMNGGTFNTMVSSIFVAQLEGIELRMPETIVMCVTTILLFISAPGTVSGGNSAILLAVLASGGIERPQFISVVISMDWFLDRFRTMMNVVGDCYVAAFVESLCRDRLSPDDEPGETYPSPVLYRYDHQEVIRKDELCQSSESPNPSIISMNCADNPPNPRR